MLTESLAVLGLCSIATLLVASTISNCYANWSLYEFSPRSVGFLCSERTACNAWSVVFGTDWDAIYVLEIGAFQAEPAVELVCIGFSVAGFELGAAY